MDYPPSHKKGPRQVGRRIASLTQPVTKKGALCHFALCPERGLRSAGLTRCGSRCHFLHMAKSGGKIRIKTGYTKTFQVSNF